MMVCCSWCPPKVHWPAKLPRSKNRPERRDHVLIATPRTGRVGRPTSIKHHLKSTKTATGLLQPVISSPENDRKE